MPDATTTAGALAGMVASIMDKKRVASAPLSPLPPTGVPAYERVRDQETYDLAMRHVQTIRTALTNLTGILTQMAGVDPIDEGQRYFRAGWRCKMHPDLSPQFKAIGDDRHVVAACLKCGAWDEDALREPSLMAETIEGADVALTELRLSEVVSPAAEAAVETTAAVEATAPDHWVCPEHNVSQKSKTRKGREYYVCTQCAEFEKLA